LPCRLVFFLCVIPLCFLLPSSAKGARIIVPCDCETIQDAIDRAGPGDLILVQPGTYRENISFNGKAIRVVSDQGPAVTTLDGMMKGAVVSFLSGETTGADLSGFTITNGTGILYEKRLRGGGIVCGNCSSPTISGNILTKNSAYNGGAIACFQSSAPTITNNILIGNSARYGGAIDLDESSPLVAGNTFEENDAVVHGGGMHCANGSDSAIDGNVFSGNTTNSGRGGAIYSYKSSPAVTNNHIADNYAWKCGGGFYGRKSNSLIHGNWLGRNRSETGYGGGINFSSSSMPVISNNIVNRNHALYGGGINCYLSCSGTIVNNLIINNTAVIRGGGINCDDNTTLSIVNNTITSNTAANSGGGFCCAKASTATVVNTIFWNNNASSGPEIFLGNASLTSTISLSYSDIMGGYSSIKIVQGCSVDFGPGNIDSDPGFVERTKGDFHLSYKSSCRDAGSGLASQLPSGDFEGDPRSTMASVDIGADEFHYRLYAMGAVAPGNTIDIRVIGEPQKMVTLGFSMNLLDPPQPTPQGPLFIEMPMVNSWKLGRIPANGAFTLSVKIPVSWTTGVYHFQALVGTWGGNRSRLTNLLQITID
jgi:hypothetical protein